MSSENLTENAFKVDDAHAPTDSEQKVNGPTMVVEQRTYVLKAEVALLDYLGAYKETGLEVQRKILGNFLGYYVTEFGVQNEVNHFWMYADLEDRRRRRSTLANDTQWQECLRTIRPMIETMQNKIMYPTSFSPVPPGPNCTSCTR